MQQPFSQSWFASVRSACITDELHWIHPLHTEETEFGQPLHCWSNTLKSALTHSRKIAILKIWSQCLLFVQSYLENFLCHQAAAVPVLPTDNLSPVCRYITEIWPVLMACTWKNRVLLAAFWVKISIFHLGQTEHRSARGDGPLCAQHRALISFIWCRAT